VEPTTAASRTFPSICDVCLGDAPGEVVRDGERVYHRRFCSRHGERLFLVSKNGDRYLRLDSAYHRLLPPEAAPPPVNDSCFFITGRCNLACPFCALEANRHRYYEEMDLDSFSGAVEDCRRGKISLIGGEPLEHPRILEFAEAVGKSGRTLALFTNGLGLSDMGMLRRLVSAAPGLEIRMTFEGFHAEAYGRHSNGPVMERKLAALSNLERLGVNTVLGHTIAAGSDPASVSRTFSSTISFAMGRGFVRGLTFQGAVALGAARRLSSEEMLPVDAVMDLVAASVPVPVPRDAAFAAQKLLCVIARIFNLPMCSYVQTLPLFHSGRGWVSLDHYFDLDRLDAEIDGLAADPPSTRAGMLAAASRAVARSARMRRFPGFIPLAARLLPVFAGRLELHNIPGTVLPLVSISVCDRHNFDATVARRCEKQVFSSVQGGMKGELCSGMMIRQLRERESGGKGAGDSDGVETGPDDCGKTGRGV
jgi:hypothetical protein